MSAAPNPKLCINCKHVLTPRTPEDRYRCAHLAHGIDLVSGNPITPACRDQRDYLSSMCGPSGYLFEHFDAQAVIANQVTTLEGGAA